MKSAVSTLNTVPTQKRYQDNPPLGQLPHDNCPRTIDPLGHYSPRITTTGRLPHGTPPAPVRVDWFKFKHIYFTSIEKQVLTTYTNLSRFCFLGTTPVLALNVWANVGWLVRVRVGVIQGTLSQGEFS